MAAVLYWKKSRSPKHRFEILADGGVGVKGGMEYPSNPYSSFGWSRK